MNRRKNRFYPLSENPEISITHQNLPHWEQDHSTYFVTYRLHDSVPTEKQKLWKEQINLWLMGHPIPWDDDTWFEYNNLFKTKQKWLDSGFGSCLLRSEQVRELIIEGLHHFDGARYVLDAFVVMPNHIHLLIKPLQDFHLKNILHSLKAYSARQINSFFERKGKVWMDESYDHIVRSWHQLEYYRKYIQKNPENLPSSDFSLGCGHNPLVDRE